MPEPWRCLVLTCLLTLTSGETRCVGEWHTGLTLDLEVTKSSNATLVLLGTYSARAREDCERGCCKCPTGACTVANFHQHDGNGTCYFYKCTPLFLCTLSPKNGTETFMFTHSYDSDNSSDLNDTVHGDGRQSKPRKGVFPQEVEEGPLKHDNTTVKPRKGVLKEHNVNARKGVEKETLAISSDVFSDDPTANNSFNDVIGPSSMTLSLGNEPANTSQTEQNVSDTTTTSQPEQITSKEAVGEDQSNFTDASTSTIDLQTTQAHQTTSSAPTVSSTTTTTPAVPSTTTTPTVPSTTTTPTVPSTTATLASTTPAPVPTVETVADELATSTTRADGEMSDWEFVQTSTSLHLVIGLVLGLMLLLTVMGVVAKRIHDSWQRRHYHRMDFLIDGMYHGET